MVDLARLHVSFLAGTLGQGGAERQLYYILRTLRDRGAKVRLLSLSRGEFWEERIRALGIPVVWVGQSSARFVRLFRVLAALRDDPPDVLQSQHFYTNLYAAAAARWLGVPSVGAMRNRLAWDMQNVGRLGGLALRFPELVAANSLTAIDEAEALGVASDQVHYLPNVVDTDRFSPAGSGGSDEGRVTLAAVGRLARQKRFDRFLDVVAGLRGQTDVPVRAEIVGDGPQRSRLERYADRLDLRPDGVVFRGRVPDAVPVYRESDVLLLTSDWEGTPNVVLEAMACGLPVVAARVGNVPRVIEDGRTGFLVAPEDVAGMIDVTRRLVHDPHLRRRVGVQARAYVLEHHALTRLPAYLVDLYDKVLSPRAQRAAGDAEGVVR
jgi:glycosyltransferase involved in cell wall biosynthesis